MPVLLECEDRAAAMILCGKVKLFHGKLQWDCLIYAKSNGGINGQAALEHGYNPTLLMGPSTASHSHPPSASPPLPLNICLLYLPHLQELYAGRAQPAYTHPFSGLEAAWEGQGMSMFWPVSLMSGAKVD